MKIFALLCLTFGVVNGQFFQNSNDITLSVALKPPPPQEAPIFVADNSIIPLQQQRPKPYAHKAVLFNAEQESKLPAELLNPFYKNPRIADALAKQSWFAAGEKHVTDRESESIPRDQIYYALKSAGLIRRKRSLLPNIVHYYYL